MVNSTDPAKELQWLIHELQAAEDNGEKVHIIGKILFMNGYFWYIVLKFVVLPGHIAPGSSDCMKVWSRNFYAIIDRFESTILAQFYGHSHADEFEVFYDVQENSNIKTKGGKLKQQRNNKDLFTFTGRPTGVAYLGPSVTTYDHYNPAYRIYYVDGDHENTTRVLNQNYLTIPLLAQNLLLLKYYCAGCY